jgi:hypothetical protein
MTDPFLQMLADKDPIPRLHALRAFCEVVDRIAAALRRSDNEVVDIQGEFTNVVPNANALLRQIGRYDTNPSRAVSKR